MNNLRTAVITLVLTLVILLPSLPIGRAQNGANQVTLTSESARALPAQDVQVGRAGVVQLSTKQIPEAPASLPLFKLSNQKPPTDFVQEALRLSAPEYKKLAPLAENQQLTGKEGRIPSEIVGAFADGQLAAYVNLRTGDAEMYPSLTRQKPIAATAASETSERAASLAEKIFRRPDVLQQDATQVTFEKPRPLLGESARKGENSDSVKSSDSELYLTYVPVRRSIDNHFVYGPGSRALLAVGNDGSVQGFVRRWKTAVASGQTRETRSRDQVAESIRAQFQYLARSAEVEILSVELAYYDGNRDYLQPVYRFTSRLRQIQSRTVTEPKPTNRRVDDDFVVGYLPIGKQLESLPSLLAPTTSNPNTPPRRPTYSKPEPDDPTVGRYVVRNDDSNWVADANEFWSGLTTFFGSGLFTNSQYYWAYPFEFDTSEAAFVNTVNVALTEVHGDWWYFTTYQNWGDGVDITAIPASRGYGAANGGQLDYWIIHSCEVVPSPADAPCATDSRQWWTPWFRIFRGLHTVVGYRTIMWIDDDVGGPYGVSLRFGAPVVSAWFNATNSAAGYQGNPTYQAHCGNSPPMGRPSTVSFCGRENDSVYNTAALPAASCLVNYWQPN
jgi:hypothetical protein